MEDASVTGENAFRSGPAPAWQELLEEHTPHLLMLDEAAAGPFGRCPVPDEDMEPDTDVDWGPASVLAGASTARPAADKACPWVRPAASLRA
ncbi:hypothetical protein [Streptomyces sp. NPDC051776]|uniref:hypothetical protein n=1 Tax=Streptomyces sp. NPDC051776 TaxID=3155414 RepID=UPI00342D57AD